MTSAARGRIKVLFQGDSPTDAGSRNSSRAGRRWMATEQRCSCADRTTRRDSQPSNWRARCIAGQIGLLPGSGPEDMLVAAAAEADIGVIPYRPLIRNDRFACPNKLSQYLHAGLMVVTNDLPYVKSVIHDARRRFIVRFLRPYQPGCCDQSDRRRPPTARQVPAKRVAIRQAIVQLAVSR